MKNHSRVLAIFLSLILATVSVGSWLLAASAASGTISGKVVGPKGPVAGAHVRVRATDNLVFSDEGGEFVLTNLTEGLPLQISAWYSGFYIASTVVTPTAENIELLLRPYHKTDNSEYLWKSPISGTTAKACGNCHPMIFPQWSGNAHGGAISNPRFFSLYNGTDLSGQLVVEPGYRLDFPETAGSCANCHAPGAGADGYLTTRMDEVRGVITAGIHCDYCHKVGDVYLDPGDQSVYPNAPGVRSQHLLRPPPGDDIFLGPYDDIPDPDTYLPLIRESQFCAPCHQFSFWGTPIYESYGEWLASPYADKGITCQDCHMPPNGDTYFADPAKGGLAHPPETIPSHLQLGASDAPLLADTVDMALQIQDAYGQLRVTVTITNSGAGHHVPTDFPGRQMILLVTVRDENGQILKYIDGPVVPGWGGAQAGKPGKIYAKVLKDIDSGEFPVVSYWKPALIVSDNRLPALEADISSYFFSPPPGGESVKVQALLLFRRLMAEDAQDKKWESPDITMETVELIHFPAAIQAHFFPIVASSD
jgi:hypothetical protein